MSLDPRIKILGATAISLSALASEPRGLSLLTIILVGVVVASGVPLHRVLAAARPFLVFLALIFLAHTVSPTGIWVGAEVVWRLAVVAGGGLLLSLTTRPTDAADGLSYLISPFIGPRWGRHIGMTLALAIRFVGVLHEEAVRLLRAQASRGVDLRNPFNLAALAVPLIVRAIRRAQEAADALIIRGYRGDRTRIRPLRMGKKDFAVLLGAFLVAFVSVFL